MRPTDRAIYRPRPAHFLKGCRRLPHSFSICQHNFYICAYYVHMRACGGPCGGRLGGACGVQCGAFWRGRGLNGLISQHSKRETSECSAFRCRQLASVSEKTPHGCKTAGAAGAAGRSSGISDFQADLLRRFWGRLQRRVTALYTVLGDVLVPNQVVMPSMHVIE